MGARRSILFTADCAEVGLVRLDIKGPPYRLLPTFAILSGEGWQLITKAAKPPTSARGATRARRRRQ